MIANRFPDLPSSRSAEINLRENRNKKATRWLTTGGLKSFPIWIFFINTNLMTSLAKTHRILPFLMGSPFFPTITKCPATTPAERVRKCSVTISDRENGIVDLDFSGTKWAGADKSSIHEFRQIAVPHGSRFTPWIFPAPKSQTSHLKWWRFKSRFHRRPDQGTWSWITATYQMGWFWSTSRWLQTAKFARRNKWLTLDQRWLLCADERFIVHHYWSHLGASWPSFTS